MIDDAPIQFESDRTTKRDESATLLAVAMSLLRHRRLLLLSAFAGFVLPMALLLARAPRFTVSSSFIPQSRRGSGVAGLAAQFGVVVASGDAAEQSPSFYVDLVQTRAILGALIDSTRYEPGNVVPGQNLVLLFGKGESNSLRRRENVIDGLRRALTVGFSQRTGVVTVSATMRSPELAKNVVEQLIREVNRFNTNSRQSQAAAERRFIEERSFEAANELRAAEGRQRDFLIRNREYRSSPQLLFEYERMSREVALRQQLYGTLAQAYDQAKIEEVRDTPLISLIERAEVPAQPDSRGLVRWGILCTCLALLFGSIVALSLDYFSANESESGAMHDLRTVRDAALADLRILWPVRRRNSKLDKT